jgi:hypothetical protein
MRTTLTIDDDVLDLAKSLARSRDISTGQALSILARRGASARSPTAVRNGFVVFQVPASTPEFGPQDVAAALADEGSEVASLFRSSVE